MHDDKINNLLMLGDDDLKCLGFRGFTGSLFRLAQQSWSCATGR